MRIYSVKGGNKVMKLTRLAVLAFTMATALVAADIDGKWKGQLPGRDGNMREISFDFKADGTALTGSMQGFRGEVPISEGKIESGAVLFKVSMNMGGTAMVMHYSGNLGSGDLKMKMATEGSPRSVEFLLKKQ